MKHLYTLGHRKIAILRGPNAMEDSLRRWHGIQRFAAEAGLRLDPRLTVELPSLMDPVSGFEGGMRLTAGLIESKIDFSSILAFDDLTALGAMRALWAAERRVPDDCSVVGFDDVPHAALASPAITTIRQPMLEMGELAANLVLDAIAPSKPGAPRSRLLHQLPPELIQRDSTRMVPGRRASKSSS
jgi:LacI family transcriptional regulator